MTVDSFDPKSVNNEVTDADLARLLRAARQLEEDNFGLAASEIARLASLSRHPQADWALAAARLGDDDVVALVKLFTLAESAFAGWQAGAKSPVVPLVALLKRRGTYPDDLTRWIKANSENRFLPYGSLMDRL